MTEPEPTTKEIPLGPSAPVLSELYAVAQGGRQVAEAAVTAANLSHQRYMDALAFFRLAQGIPNNATVNLDFARGVLTVGIPQKRHVTAHTSTPVAAE